MFRVLRCYLALWIIATTFAVETMAQSPPRKLAFLVGVSRYQKEGLRNLRYAEDDIRELALELRKLGFKTYGVLGAKATLSGINVEIEKFYGELRKLNKEDIVILAFSGHGLQLVTTRDNKRVEEPFFCPADALKSDPHTLLPFNQMMARIEQESGSRQNMLLIDTCRDNPAKGTKGLDGSSAERLPDKISILFGSEANMQSYESDQLRHGIFTHFVLQGLRGHAADRNGQITWLNLASYVMQTVPSQSPKLLHDETITQRPNLIG